VTHDEILSKIQDVLEQDFQVARARVTPEATFRGTLGMDSLDAVDLIYLLAKSFGIPAELHAFASLHTVKSVVEHVAREQAKMPQGA
jgi:acyl carrier protein